MNEVKSPEEVTDFERRRGEFISSYGKLVEEFHCDFMTRPVFIPSNDANRTWHFTFDTQVVDTTDMPVPSPFQL